MHYRSDIDGLRAVAVLLVVFFHFGFEVYFPGGFIGVDVFFVISGFLITKIIVGEIDSGTFSLVRFYERRVRRILPALIGMYIFILASSFMLFMPSETKQQAINVISSALFASNIYFYYTHDYFDAASEFNAALHTWSLSVEEQFYIFFPLMIRLISKHFRAHLKATIIGLALISFIAAQWQLAKDPSAVFYMFWFRAWELLVGSMLAVGVFPSSAKLRLTNAASLLGTGLIAGSALFLSRSTPFPALAALPSCAGAAMIIWAGLQRQNFVGWALGLQPARFIGKISYSLYLWHWPLLIMTTQVMKFENGFESLQFVLFTIVVAAFSWKFIEQPFRSSGPDTEPNRPVYVGLAGLAITCGVAAIIPLASTIYWRVPQRVEQVASFIGYSEQQDLRAGRCFLSTKFNEFNQFDQAACLRIQPGGRNYLLVGDSHAAQYYPGLAHQSQMNILQATATGCRPLGARQGADYCKELVDYVLNDFLPRTHVEGVIFAARWRDKDLTSIEADVQRIRPYADKIIFLGPVAEYEKALPRILAQSIYRNDPALPEKYLSPDPFELDRKMRKVVETAGAQYVSIVDALCPNRHCSYWTSDGNPIQFDYGHLTSAGSDMVIDAVAPSILGLNRDDLPIDTSAIPR